MSTRRGFTLVELLIALVLTVSVGGIIMGLVSTTQKVSRSQAAVAAMQSNVRAGSLIVPADLREIGYDTMISVPTGFATPNSSPDLITIAPTSIRFRAMRGFGVVCQLGTTEIKVAKPWFYYRDPTTSDSFRLFVENNQAKAADDEWWPIQVTAIDETSTCGARPAWALTVNDLSALTYLISGTTLAITSGIFDGAPLRAWEDMEYGLYQSGGQWWLGARSHSNGDLSYQPVLGPVMADSGVTFRYLDKNEAVIDPTGNTEAARRAVRTIEITVRGETDERVALHGGDNAIANQRLTARVALRNVLRP